MGRPARRIVRSVPLPTVSRRAGRTAMYPDDAAARALFESVGDVIVPENEPTLATFGAATATFSARLAQLAAIAGWMADNGVSQADAYVAHVYGELGRKHETPGGINAQFRTAGQDDDRVRKALDDVLTRVKGQ